MSTPDITVKRLNDCRSHKVTIRSAVGPPVELCQGSHGSYLEILYPDKEISSISNFTVFDTGLDGCSEYEVKVTEECLVEGPMMHRGVSTCAYLFQVRDDGTYCTSITELDAQGNCEITRYQDGPQRSVLRTGQRWVGRSLVMKAGESQYTLDIESSHFVDESAYLVEVDGKGAVCIKQQTICVPYRGAPPLRQVPELLLEHYFDMAGSHVLTRRYNGPIWEKWNGPLHDRLKKNPFVESGGYRFFLWYDLLVSENSPNKAIQADAFGAADF